MRFLPGPSFVAIFALLAMAPPARAAEPPPPPPPAAADIGEEIDLEALFDTEVEVATKRAQALAEAPAVVAVVTADDIRERGYMSVAEALRSIPGFYVVDDYLLPSLGVRGIPSGQRAWSRIVKLMVDGFPVPYRPEATNFLGPELIPIDLVQRIEVIRGPGSALYGADAFLGVVNVVTKRGEDIAGVAVNGSAGYFAGHPQTQGSVTAGGSIPNSDAEVIVGLAAGRGDRSGLTVPASSALAPKLANQKSSNDTTNPVASFARIGNITTPVGQLGVDILTQRLNSGAEFQDWKQFTHLSRVALDNRMGRVALRSHPFEKVNTTATVAVSRGGPSTEDRISIGRPDSIYRRDLGTDAIEGSLEGTYALNPRDGLTLGADYAVNRHRLPSYFSVFTAGTPRAGEEVPAGEPGEEKSFSNLGAYGQGIWHPYEDLALTLGLRLDQHNIYGNVLNYRGGLVNPFGNGWTGKVLYGTSFKAPSPQQLFGRPLVFGDILGNIDLKPERAQTVEAALNYAAGRQLDFLVNAYYTHVDDRIGFVASGGNSKAVNQAGLDSAGLETELKWRWQILHGMLNLSLQKTAALPGDEAVSDDSALPPEAYPTATANAGIGAPLGDWPVSAYLESRFVTAVPSTQSNFAANGLTAYELPAATVVDLTFTSREWSWRNGTFGTSLKFANLLDAEYAQPGFGGVDYPGRGRTIWMRMGYAW